ncbi:MAG: DUF4115 domain-containing protein [bacterium]|nr:DUF4115 domain-containing protein [bacterium]
MSIGKILQEARVKKGISVQQANVATKIKREYIEALESERFELIPSSTYVKGFLKIYGDFLGVDCKKLISEYAIRYAQEETSVIQPEKNIERFQTASGAGLKLSKLGIFIIACVLVLLAVSVIKIVFFSGRSEDKYFKEITSSMPSQYFDVNTDSVKLPPVTAPLNKNQNEVEVYATENVWMSVWVDEQEYPAGTLSAGQSEKWNGKKIHLKIGNAGGLKVRVNGKELAGLGAKGEVIHLYIDNTGIKKQSK